MFEITYSDNETFEAYQNAGKAHKGGTYDFTFENRQIIYHANLRHKVDYLSLIHIQMCIRDRFGTYRSLRKHCGR